MARKTKNEFVKNAGGARLGFEKKLWAADDKMLSNIDPTEYKHVVLELIFLKYISDASRRSTSSSSSGRRTRSC